MDTFNNIGYYFPIQRVSNKEKQKPEWYANSIDYVIDLGVSCRSDERIRDRYDILDGQVSNNHYKKILNPYNATDEKYKRFPAEMRNYDIMKGVIRRYVSEYIKNPHDFIVGANNAEVVMNRDAKVKQQLTAAFQIHISNKIAESYQNYINQGGDPQQFNPQQQFNVEEELKKFQEEFVDDISAQGQELLKVINDDVKNDLLYTQAYYDFVAHGRCFSYSDVVGTKLVKKIISPIDAYPIPNDSQFVEDHDMFACVNKMTYQQIIDEYYDYLDKDQKEWLEEYYNGSRDDFTANDYMAKFGELWNKFSTEESANLIDGNNVLSREINNGLINVWHVVWRSDARRGILTYQHNGIVTERVVEDDYKLVPELGDISIRYVFEPQVYEGVRIGTRNDAIYPYKARPIAFNRDGKLPYNGILEVLKGFGEFSIVDILTPYQVLINILYYHREMTIAKNKANIMVMPKSLLGENPEDTLYRMAADSVLMIDDEEDHNSLKAQQVRMLSATLGGYINEITQLINEVKAIAKEEVDMTPQRYGAISNSAGKGVTEEAVIRGSMGTVIIEYIFDEFREKDCARDLDFTKLAWIDGLDTSYNSGDEGLRYISLDVNNHVYADYNIVAKNSVVEREKLNQIKQFAFSAAQNGNMDMAIAAIAGDNVASIKKLIMKFQEITQQQESKMEELRQQGVMKEHELELEKITAKGDQDRQTLELEKLYDKDIALLNSDSNLVNSEGVSSGYKEAAAERIAANKTELEREKNRVQETKNLLDYQSQEADRQIKREDIKSKERIAKTNKNRFDKK